MRSIISICRNFLWTGDVRRGTTALVAWKTICMPKAEGGLGLFDLSELTTEVSLASNNGIFT
jgi:hypothetical protein